MPIKMVVAKKATKRQHFLEVIMGVAIGKSHLFRKRREGKTFYYYWYQQGDKRVFKSCDRACTQKREAVAYLEKLLKADLTEEKQKSVLASMTVKDFAKDALSHVKSNHWALKISRKKLTMENPAYFQKSRFLEERNGIYHGGKKQDQGRIR
jgi:hypothetical protein